MRPTPNRTRGFTFVELMVVAGTLGMLSVMIAAGLQQGQEFASTEMSLTSGEARLAASLDKVRRQLAVARVDSPVSDGTRVRFQVPIDHDGDGVPYDTTGDVTFGYDVGGVPTLGAAAWYAFLVDQVVTEAALALDVNQDGDLEDSFELGHLQLDAPDAEVAVSGVWFVQEAGDPGGDFDGDGAPDPMFSLLQAGDSDLVRLRLFGVQRVADGTYRRFAYDSSVRLRNDT